MDATERRRVLLQRRCEPAACTFRCSAEGALCAARLLVRSLRESIFSFRDAKFYGCEVLRIDGWKAPERSNSRHDENLVQHSQHHLALVVNTERPSDHETSRLERWLHLCGEKKEEACGLSRPVSAASSQPPSWPDPGAAVPFAWRNSR